MSRPRRTRPATAQRRRPTRRDPRVLVHLITEPKRRFVCIKRASVLTVTKPADLSKFGLKECEGETNRRKALLDLLTDEESDLLNHYCRIRDE